MRKCFYSTHLPAKRFISCICYLYYALNERIKASLFASSSVGSYMTDLGGGGRAPRFTIPVNTRRWPNVGLTLGSVIDDGLSPFHVNTHTHLVLAYIP